MNSMLNQIADFFGNGTPMNPAASWLLMGLLVVAATVITLAIREFDLFTELAINNAKVIGAKGVWHAFLGREVVKINKERVISITPREYGYVVHTSDSEYDGEYHILVTETDGSGVCEKAREIAGSNKDLYGKIMPDSRVCSYFRLTDKETDEELEFFSVYLKYNNCAELEEALNRYFEEEYLAECKSARKMA